MRKSMMVALAAAIVASPTRGTAQSEKALVGWAGLMTTPVGALPPFVSPGYGVGYINGDGYSESGWRAMLGGGAALSGLGSGLEITVSAHRVFIEEGATMYGLALRLWR